MRAGISYNVFNGEEHLLASLRQVRPHVEHINAVVQYVSYAGNPCSASLRPTLSEAIRTGLLDHVEPYEPVPDLSPAKNELAKRSLGLEIARADSVTHFMTMDCDEFYVPEEFAAARAFIAQHGIRASAVPTYLHIRRPIWRSRFPEPTYCAFLTEINSNSRLTLGAPYPVLVDPKRRLHGEALPFHTFSPAVLAMYHMNLVRRDLKNKLANSPNAANSDFMVQVLEAYEGWHFGMPLVFPRKPPMEIIEVADIFGLESPLPRLEGH